MAGDDSPLLAAACAHGAPTRVVQPPSRRASHGDTESYDTEVRPRLGNMHERFAYMEYRPLVVARSSTST